MSDNAYNGKKYYTCEYSDGHKYRGEYLDSLERLIETRLNDAYSKRESYMPPEKLKRDPEKYRREYLEMIGFPFDLVEEGVPNAECNYVGQDDFCKLYRLSIEVFEGFHFYGVLMVPDGEEKMPLVIAQHGGGGSPELCSDMIGQNNYSYFTKRILEKKMVIFAPQLLLWNFKVDTGEKFPKLTLPYDRHGIDRNLRKLGYSITGIEVLCLMRSIDYLVTHERVDKDRIGMTGLSYGGYFTLHTAAADTRIRSAYAAGFFNDRAKISFADWSYDGAAYKFHDAEVAGLVAPRNLIIAVGKEDAVFDYHPSIAEADRIKKYYEVYDASDNFKYNLWDGGHRFDVESDDFDRFFEHLK